MELLLNLPVRTFLVDTKFQCVFWTFLLWEIGWNFQILRSASTSHVFVENVALQLYNLEGISQARKIIHDYGTRSTETLKY